MVFVILFLFLKTSIISGISLCLISIQVWRPMLYPKSGSLPVNLIGFPLVLKVVDKNCLLLQTAHRWRPGDWSWRIKHSKQTNMKVNKRSIDSTKSSGFVGRALVHRPIGHGFKPNNCHFMPLSNTVTSNLGIRTTNKSWITFDRFDANPNTHRWQNWTGSYKFVNHSRNHWLDIYNLWIICEITDLTLKICKSFVKSPTSHLKFVNHLWNHWLDNSKSTNCWQWLSASETKGSKKMHVSKLSLNRSKLPWLSPNDENWSVAK